MLRNTFLAFVTVTAAALAAPATADTLIINGIDVDRGRSIRGLSMATLRSRWGEPQTTRNAVGDPPITRWEYSDFVVFFEFDHVIHAVQKR